MPAHVSNRFDAFRVGLALLLAGVSIWAAIAPVSRFDWFMENVLVWITVVVIACFGAAIRISRTASLLLALFLAMQIYASHYAYEPVIGVWISAVFESPRNSFDRVIHLCFGILLFLPIMECFQNMVGMSRKTAMFCTVLAITALGAVYEVIEWGMLVVLDPKAGVAFVGAQGDPWDAQKDMALALLGSLSTAVGVLLWQRRDDNGHCAEH